MNDAVHYAMICDARNELTDIAHRTALVPAPTSVFGSRSVFLKTENLQKTGSFKIRGAFNKMLRLTDAEKAAGVVAASAGNHAQGVALAARMLGIPATIVMPEGAPISKISSTQGYGAEVVLHGGTFDDAYDRSVELQKRHGYTFIHPFNDPHIIAGQGTVGLEILQDLPDCQTIVVPVGGGGLISGIAIAAKTTNPGIRVIGVEPERAASMRVSVLSGQAQTVAAGTTMADGVAVRRPGELTFELCRRYVDDIVTVSEDEIAMTILMLLERSKMLVEGAGACAIAALYCDKLPGKTGKTVAVLSGGNIDVNLLSRIIERGLIESGRRSAFSTVMPDKPGSLHSLIELVSAAGANILSVAHSRTGGGTEIGFVEVALEVETHNRAHLSRLFAAIEAAGYALK